MPLTVKRIYTAASVHPRALHGILRRNMLVQHGKLATPGLDAEHGIRAPGSFI